MCQLRLGILTNLVLEGIACIEHFMKKQIPQALFLDRDGTLIRWVDYLYDPKQVELCEGIATALVRAKESGCLLFLHTNQSGVGRGYFGLDAVEAVNRTMCELMGVDLSIFDGVCIATEHPDFQEEGKSRRKPSPLFEREMLSRYSLDPERCFMIGDSMCDLQTGINAGIGAVLVRSEQTKLGRLPEAALEYASVAAFVEERF